MQELAITKVSFAYATDAVPFYQAPIETPVAVAGRVGIGYVFGGSAKHALVRSEPGWEVYLFSEGNAVFACAFDTARNNISVERFEKGQAPKSKLLTGAERAAVIGASFATDAPADIVSAVDLAGF